MIHIGDVDGRRVEIPVHHTGVFGQTGVGKTRLLKYMMQQAVNEGCRVLIFDSKVTGPEFEGMGVRVPFYVEENTDPDVYRSLLEGARARGRGNMERFRGGFIEVCSGARSFEDIGRNLQSKLDAKTEKGRDKITGFTRAMYQEIFYDHRRLMAALDERSFGTYQDIHRALSSTATVLRVPTHVLPNLALQGLVVRSIVELALRTPGKMIILVDEAPNFVSQKQYNPAKSALQQLDAQGRSALKFGWYSGQTITGFDKSNMKNLWYWIMGREMERNEAKDVFDTQTTKACSVDQVKRLKVREFIVSTPEGAQVATVPEVKEKDGVLLFGGEGWTRPSQPNIGQEGEEQIGDGPKGAGEASPKPVDALNPVKSREGQQSPGTPSGVRNEVPPPPARERGVEGTPTPPEPRTKQLAAFSLEVTRLESDSAAGKVAYLVKQEGSLTRGQIVHLALEHGWTELTPESLRKTVLPGMVRNGLLVNEVEGHHEARYRLPHEVKVREVPM